MQIEQAKLKQPTLYFPLLHVCSLLPKMGITTKAHQFISDEIIMYLFTSYLNEVTLLSIELGIWSD